MKITVDLSPKGINELIAEVEKYKKWLHECAEKLVKTLSEEGMNIARSEFLTAQYDGENDVQVSIDERGELKSAVVAVGNAVLFIEFGTGVQQPDFHPEQQFQRGSYGHHLGKLSKWRYKGNPGTNGEPDPRHEGYIVTRGNPSNMSLYKAKRNLEQTIQYHAERIFRYE